MMNLKNNPVIFFLSILVFIFTGGPPAFSLENIENELGGHFKVNGSGMFYDDDSFYSQGKNEEGFDGFINFRLKEKLIVSDRLFFEVHYDSSLEGGDTYKKTGILKNQFPMFADKFGNFEPSENGNFFDLTKTIKETDDYISWHRLDRLVVSYKPFWGDIAIGRQSVTWGNGLVFNPADLFNPFSFSDTTRDYKAGKDLVSIRLNSEKAGEPEFLYIPGKEENSNDIKQKKSSFAGKVHYFVGETEFDFMLAKHFDEVVGGIGATGTLINAAWRSDVVYSTLDNNSNRDGFFTYIINIDYSWVWKGKNFYGFIEYFHNDLGKKDSTKAFTDFAIAERLQRGEIFTLCRDYLSAHVKVEIHPLFNVSFNVISNLNDSSGLIQPRAIWSISQNSELDFGISKAYGKKGTEFGGTGIPGTPYYFKSTDNIYIAVSYYF